MICDEIERWLAAQFRCYDEGDRIRIETPYVYPDGDVVDIFAVNEGTALRLTDLGETNRWLWLQTPSVRRSPRQRSLINDICDNHGVTYQSGELQVLVTDSHEVAKAVTNLAQAILNMADIYFVFRSQGGQSIKEDVAEFLADALGANRIKRDQEFRGRSNRAWVVDFVTKSPKRDSLIQVLYGGSKATARRSVERALSMWYDLQAYKSTGLQFVSLFDDTVDVWAEEDFNLVDGLSEVAYWSRPTHLIELVA